MRHIEEIEARTLRFDTRLIGEPESERSAAGNRCLSRIQPKSAALTWIYVERYASINIFNGLLV